MNFTDRNLFLENFREKNGLSRNTSYNFEKNKSKKLNLSQGEGRWELLYQVDKLNKIKLEESRKKIQKEEIEKDLKECTFSPKLNKNRGNSYLSFANTSAYTLTNNNITTNSKYRMESYGNITNPKLFGSRNILHSEYSNNFADIHQRQKNWNTKKNFKLLFLKEKSREKELEQCFYKPKIVNLYFY